MSIDEFKQKANEIKENLEPKVKETAKKAGKKVKSAGEKVSDFAAEHFSKKDVDEKDIVEAEYRDVTDVVTEPAEETLDEAENTSAEAENTAETVENTENDNKKNKKNSKKDNKRGKKNKNQKSADKPVEETEEKAAEESTKKDEVSIDDLFVDNTSDENAQSNDDNTDSVTADNESVQNENVNSDVEDNTADNSDENIDEESNDDKQESEIERIEGVVVGTMKDKFGQFKTNVLPKMKDVATNIGDKVKETAQDLAPKAKETAQNVGNFVKDRIQDIGPKAKETVQDLGPKAKETALNVGSKVKETVQDFAPKAKDTVVDTAKQVGPKMYEGAKKAGETISFQGYRLRKSLGKKMKNSIRKKLGLGEDTDSDGIKYYEVKKKKTNRLVAHTRTVLTHKKMVFKHCVKAGIPLQGLTHDLSKFSPTEFINGVKFYRGDKSPNEGEREDHGFSYAWMHHKGRNKHHFEYWNDYNIEANKALPVKMPLKYVIEMFCDRVAASKVYLKGQYTNKSPYEYFDKARSRRCIHQETSDFLEKLLKMLAEKGEPYTFMYIRWYMKHHKDY
jgi:hypothetical protein